MQEYSTPEIGDEQVEFKGIHNQKTGMSTSQTCKITNEDNVATTDTNGGLTISNSEFIHTQCAGGKVEVRELLDTGVSVQPTGPGLPKV